MGNNKKTSHGNTYTFPAIVGAFLLICLTMGALCFQYYYRLQYTVKAESGEYLEEISKHMSINVSKNISDNFSVLGTVSTLLKSSGVTSYAELLPIVKEQQTYWNYQSILLIDKSGVAYDSNGNTVMLSADEYIQDAIVGRKHSMSAAQVVNGKECIVFAIPIDDIVIGDTTICALAASYDLATFDSILSITAFEGKGYAHIVRNDGAVVVRSTSPSSSIMGYNVLNSMANATFNGEKNFDDLKLDIASSQNGQVEFTFNGSHEYMAYTPIEGHEWYLFTFVPVSVVNAKSELFIKITLLISAVITFIFALLMAFLMTLSNRHKHKLEKMVYVDPVTCGHTIRRFYELMQVALDAPHAPQYALVYTNIAKFKVLNDQFGRNACDMTLKIFDRGISSVLRGKECIGRIYADNFCILLEYKDEASFIERLSSLHSACDMYETNSGAAPLPLMIELGVYIIGKEPISLPSMTDRAKLSLKNNMTELFGNMRYAIYDEQMSRKLLREKQIEDMMEHALIEREFQVYLQPKYHTQSEQISGAEALVRWLSPIDGMIYPDEFISVFEKNGFITKLDMWVFEEVCKTIRSWIDRGITPVCISVNCSRNHLKSPDFISNYKNIFSRYDIPAKFIEIELTENIVFEDMDCLSNVISEIHEAGFICSMDDFGSGYSSLNLIQDIMVDVLKIDKIFFAKTSSSPERSESIIGTVVSMARSLSMETVAEGVEKRAQVDMLKRLGCDYIQGYYFAKPMPIEDFEKLAF